jgi:RND family efflux transporter MFP subunit
MFRRSSTTVMYALLPLALLACGEKPSPIRAPRRRWCAPAVQEAEAASRAFTGTVAARVQSDLGFRVAGKVLERLVDAGQTVKRGQPLMRIDPADLRWPPTPSRKPSAPRARAQQASEDEARYRDLRGTGAISASAYDQVKAAADAAKAQLSAAEAQADVARNASSYAVLVADGDGVVMETLAEPGQVVNAGQPVVRLAHAGRREAVVQLPKRCAPRSARRQAVLFGKEDVSVAARLRQLSDTADRLTRTFEARYVLDGELANAPLGATVTIRIADGPAAAPAACSADRRAVRRRQGPGVWVINGEPPRCAGARSRSSSSMPNAPASAAICTRAIASSRWAPICCATACKCASQLPKEHAVSPGRFNLSALAVRERAVTLFLIS